MNCPVCDGTGVIYAGTTVEGPCERCCGTGHLETRRSVKPIAVTDQMLEAAGRKLSAAIKAEMVAQLAWTKARDAWMALNTGYRGDPDTRRALIRERHPGLYDTHQLAIAAKVQAQTEMDTLKLRANLAKETK